MSNSVPSPFPAAPPEYPALFDGMWVCPDCGRPFATKSQWHSCERASMADHLSGKPPVIREMVDAIIEVAERSGPVMVWPEKSRIALQVRMSFCTIATDYDHIDVKLVLRERVDNERFTDVETLSPGNHVHTLAVQSMDDIDRELREWIALSWRAGAQLRT